MLALLAAIPLIFAIGFIGGFSRSIRGTAATLTLVGFVFAVPAAAGQPNPGVCDGSCGASWVAPAALAVALIVPWVAGLALRNRLEHTAAP